MKLEQNVSMEFSAISRRTVFQQGAGALILVPAALIGLSVVGCGTGDSSRLLEDDFVTLYDTNAVAMYFDGTIGPTTGVIKVDFIIANQTVDMKFWHGHGGVDHRFKLLPEHFAKLKLLQKVTIETTVVEGHTHKLFIDPVDARWRVPGAQPVRVPRGTT